MCLPFCNLQASVVSSIRVINISGYRVRGSRMIDSASEQMLSRHSSLHIMIDSAKSRTVGRYEK